MSLIKSYFKIFLLAVAVFFCCNANAQVGGFGIATSATPNNLGNSFPVTISFNWANNTTSATAVINYNNALVSYDATCQNALPACMTVTNSGSAVTISIANLASCVNTGSISFNICLDFYARIAVQVYLSHRYLMEHLPIILALIRPLPVPPMEY